MNAIHTSQGESVRGRSPLTSPLTLYDDALHGIYAFLDLTELVRAAVTCKHWMAAAVKKQAGRPLSCLCLWPNVIQTAGFQRSPFVKHIAPLHMFTFSHVVTTDSLERRYDTRMSAVFGWMSFTVRPDDGLARILADMTHVDGNFGQWPNGVDLEQVLTLLHPTTAGKNSRITWINFSRTLMHVDIMVALVYMCPHLTSLEPEYFGLDALPLLDQLPHLTRLRVAFAGGLEEYELDSTRTEWNRMDFSRLKHLTLAGKAGWIQMCLGHDQHLRFPQLQSLTVVQRGFPYMCTVHVTVQVEQQSPLDRAVLFEHLRTEMHRIILLPHIPVFESSDRIRWCIEDDPSYLAIFQRRVRSVRGGGQ